MSAIQDGGGRAIRTPERLTPYFEWTVAQAKHVRKLLSTHNSFKAFLPENLPHTIEINGIVGSPMEVLAANTPKDVALPLDVGTCIEAGSHRCI